MASKVVSEFRQLTHDLDAWQWLMLGLFAGEERLAPSVLETVWPGQGPNNEAGSLSDFVERTKSRGLLAPAGRVQRPIFGRGLRSEEALDVPPRYWALTLRQLAHNGQLPELSALARTLLGEQAQSAFVAALFMGDIEQVILQSPRLGVQQQGTQEAELARQLLQRAVLCPFDSAWLEDTWGRHAPALALQVLSGALDRLEPASEAYEWLVARDELKREARELLAIHAVMRGQPEVGRRLLAAVSDVKQQLFDVAFHYLERNLVFSQQALALARESIGNAPGKGRAPPNLQQLAPLIALLLSSRGEPNANRLAKRFMRCAAPASFLLGLPSTSASAANAKAFNSLLKSLGTPSEQHQRPRVHQLPATASAWELVLLGIDVLLHEPRQLSKAGWARRLAEEAARWRQGDYHWFAEQGLALAHALDPAEVPKSSRSPGSGELCLCDLLTPEPEWRKSLGALSALVARVDKQQEPEACRVAWFVDMAQGRLSRPVLEVFRSGTGWIEARRVDPEDLSELEAELPPEDTAVLRALAAATQDSSVEALEALVGHPRVYNGARGRLPVEVVRGECRVESRQEHGHIVIRVEPENVSEGVNVVVEGESRIKVVRVTPVMAKVTSLVPSSVRVPDAHSAEALELLGKLAEHIQVDCRRLAAHEHVPSDSQVCLRISAVSGAFVVELGVRPFGPKGRFFPPGVGRPSLTVYVDEHLRSTNRDLVQEIVNVESLIQSSPTLIEASRENVEEARDLLHEPAAHWVLGEDRLFSLLLELKQAGAECAIEWQNQRPLAAQGRLSVSSLKGKLRPIKGWYLLTGSARIDASTEIDLSELVRMPFTKSGRFVRLEGGFVEVQERVKRVISALKAAGAAGARGIQVSRAALSTLEVLTSSDIGFDVAAEIQQRLTRCQQVLAHTPVLPEGLVATLRPYQVEGYCWLWRMSELELGVCLADDMGLGKTLQAAALLLHRQAYGPALVVAPTSVCANWLSELRRFAPSLDASEYAGTKRQQLLGSGRPKHDVLIASYALLQQDSEKLSEIDWGSVILDEAQFIKNPHAARAQAAFALRSTCKVALSGTPIENHLGDLWSIFHFLNPTLLGSYKQFFHRYLRPIERDKDSERREELRSLVRPFMLRRMKSQVLRDLPPLTTVRHEVRLSKEESVRYTLLCKQIHEKLRTAHGKRQYKLEVLAEITRLRRFCCHPRLVFPDAGLEASKLNALIQLCHELIENGHRALVFSQFVDFLDLVREELDEQRISYQYLDGSTARPAREASVQAFQQGDGDLFLISLKAGGFGLNLAAADYVIQLDPWWNPAVEAQATDRAHRIGQTRPVTVYRLMTRNTIEDRMDELGRDKRALANSVLEGNDVAASLSTEQLKSLLLQEGP